MIEVFDDEILAVIQTKIADWKECQRSKGKDRQLKVEAKSNTLKKRTRLLALTLLNKIL